MAYNPSKKSTACIVNTINPNNTLVIIHRSVFVLFRPFVFSPIAFIFSVLKTMVSEEKATEQTYADEWHLQDEDITASSHVGVEDGFEVGTLGLR